MAAFVFFTSKLLTGDRAATQIEVNNANIADFTSSSLHPPLVAVRPCEIKLFKIWDKSLFDYNLVFLLRKIKSTRLRAFVIIRLGGRVMKKKN